MEETTATTTAEDTSSAAESKTVTATAAAKPEKTAAAAGKKQKSEFWKGIKSEFRKIIWPDRTTLLKQSVAVVIISVITGALIAVIDRLLQYGINFLVK